MSAVTTELERRIEVFLYREARLLELNRFDEWLALVAPEVRYWMPVREVLSNPAEETEMEDGFALYDDDKRSLELRTLRVQTGIAHAEAPITITQRLITNVVVEATDKADEYAVSSNFMIYQERRGRHCSTYYGRREDRIRASGDGFLIAARRIDLAQSILPATISIFF
jgi:3-phenylpropionate/cinnamic acid dioxygenase small subunit